MPSWILFPHGYRNSFQCFPVYPGLNLSSGSGSSSISVSGSGSGFRLFHTPMQGPMTLKFSNLYGYETEWIKFHLESLYRKSPVADPGGGGALLLDHTTGWRPKKFFCRPAPPPSHLRVWMTGPFPYMNIWIRHWGWPKTLFTLFPTPNH